MTKDVAKLREHDGIGPSKGPPGSTSSAADSEVMGILGSLHQELREMRAEFDAKLAGIQARRCQGMSHAVASSEVLQDDTAALPVIPGKLLGSVPSQKPLLG